ncbi:MAG: phosphodiester glycosidase family protein [Actinomycetota bacterium]
MRRSAAIAAALVILALQACTPAVEPSGTGEPTVPVEPERTTTEVTTGLSLTEITDPAGPYKIFVLTMTPSSVLTLDVGLPRKSLGGQGPLTRIAARHDAIAAVNGDYGTSSGRPLHLFAMDGELYQTTLINRSGRNFAMSSDERRAYFGKPDASIVIERPLAGRTIDVQRWNDGAPAPAQVSGYTDRAAGLEHPPENACSARLMPDGGPDWESGEQGVRRAFTVVKVRCGEDPVDVEPDTVVVSASINGRRAAEVGDLRMGERVILTWSIGWPGVLDAIGGSALLIEDGEIVAEKCHGHYECWRHPRTGVGITADDRILLVVVDGRQEDYSIGMRREEFAELMQELGAVDALALDGGGSSTMVIEDGLVNHPPDGEERPIMSALMILAGPDPDEKL